MIEVFAGFIFGIIGGCGIGGGGILIPLLLFFTDTDIIGAKGACIVAFLPMSIFAILTHKKNGNINFKLAKKYIVSGIVFAIIGSIVMKYMSTQTVTKVFGAFMAIFSIFQTYCIFSNPIDK